jgi:pyridoxamine 5'-phosphate oxidase
LHAEAKSVFQSDFTLAEFHDAAWSLIEQGVKDRRKPAHTPSVASMGLDGRPKTRIVVLRSGDRATRTLRFHTDVRSAKIAELTQNPAVEMLMYDAQARVQLRLGGRAEIFRYPSAQAQAAWQSSLPMSKICYAVNPASGSSIESGDAFALKTIETSLPDDGIENFCAVVIHVDTIELVYLAQAANRRAKFSYQGNAMGGEWLVP